MSEIKQAKKHNRNAKLLKGAGLSTIALGSAGGFYGYQSVTNYEELQNSIQDFAVIQEESLKLDIMFALPFLVGMIVFVWISRKKNPEFFKDKVSFSLFILVFTLWLIYSIIEVTLFSLVGAFAGSLVDEVILNPLAKSQKRKAGDEELLSLETKKEEQRILARQRARNNQNGV